MTGAVRTGATNPAWRTGSKTTTGTSPAGLIPGVVASFSLPSPDYSAYTFAISGVGTLPGSMKIVNAANTPVTILDAVNRQSLGPLNTALTSLPVVFEFGKLGTYIADITLGATHQATSTTDTDTARYTFHVGPVADLEVRDAGANPALAAEQQAYTLMAVNHGPDTAPAVQVTLTDVPEGAEAVPSHGSYTQGACQDGLCEAVWNVGELNTDNRRAFGEWGEGPTLTLVTSGDPITAAIENTQAYCVRIKTGATDPSNDLPCAAGSVPTGYTEHSATYYDRVGWNNTATVEARAGTGESIPQAPSVVQYGSITSLTWTPMDALNGFAVTHYEVQRSASPWETVTDDVAATTYWDVGGDSGAAYRVRAVNDQGVPSVWSQSATPHLKPGRPMSFTATGQSDTQATLTWAAPTGVTGITGYDVEFSQDAGDTWASLATAPTQTATTYTHTDATLTAASLTPVILRQYRARTVATVEGSTVKGDWATTTLKYDKPGAPTGFSATGSNPTQATLSWAAPAGVTGITGYELEYSTDGGVLWTSLADDRTGTTLTAATARSYTHTDNDLGADDVRLYRARTVVAVGSVTVKSGWARTKTDENYAAPGAPRNFAAAADSDTQVTLTWSAPDAVDGVTHTGYELGVSTDRGVNWTSLATTSTLGTSAITYSHDDTANPLSSKPRQYRLRSVGDASGTAFNSGWVFAVPAEEVGAPQNLTATADGIGRMDLTWDLPAVGADAVTGYRIDYTPAAPESWQTLEHGWRYSPRRYEHTGLSPGERYCYRVAATYAGGTGPFAARACATTEGAPTDLPGEPENLRTTQVGSNYVALEWDKPSVGGEVEYYEYRYNNGEAVRVTPGTATSVRVGNLAPRASYSFQVRAGNSYGTGEWSREILVTLHRAAGTITASPLDLEVEKGGSGSFNVRLKRSPQWPLFVYLFFEGPDCLTEELAYQQGKILLPGNPPPSKEFWEDINWVPEPGDKYKFVQPWNTGQNYLVDASDCEGGETAVVNYDVTTVPFSYLEDVSTWEFLDLDKEEWREKWWDFDPDDDIRPDPLDGSSGPSLKVTVADGGGGTSTRQSNGGKSTTGSSGSKGAAGSSATGTEPVGMPVSRDPRPTAVSLAVAGTVNEKAGDVSIVATLDAPAPPGGIALAVNVGLDSTAGSGDLTLKSAVINIPAGQTSASGTLTIIDDPVDEDDETVVIGVLAMSGRVPLAATAKVTIQDDDDAAGMTVAAAMPSESSRGRKRLLCRGPAVREPGGRDRHRPQRRRRPWQRLRGVTRLHAGGRQRQPGER